MQGLSTSDQVSLAQWIKQDTIEIASRIEPVLRDFIQSEHDFRHAFQEVENILRAHRKQEAEEAALDSNDQQLFDLRIRLAASRAIGEHALILDRLARTLLLSLKHYILCPTAKPALCEALHTVCDVDLCHCGDVCMGSQGRAPKTFCGMYEDLDFAITKELVAIEDACAYEERSEELDFLRKAPTKTTAPDAFLHELYSPALGELVRCGILEQVLHGHNYQYNPNMYKLSDEYRVAVMNDTVDVMFIIDNVRLLLRQREAEACTADKEVGAPAEEVVAPKKRKLAPTQEENDRLARQWLAQNPPRSKAIDDPTIYGAGPESE